MVTLGFPCSQKHSKCAEFPTSSSSKHRMTCTMASDVLLWKGCECSIYRGTGRLVQVSPRKYAARVCFSPELPQPFTHPAAGTYVADVAQKLVSKALSFGSTPDGRFLSFSPVMKINDPEWREEPKKRQMRHVF